MLSEAIRILTLAEGQGRARCPTTHSVEWEAEPSRRTARSTIDAANIAAGLMLHQFSGWLTDAGSRVFLDQTAQRFEQDEFASP